MRDLNTLEIAALIAIAERCVKAPDEPVKLSASLRDLVITAINQFSKNGNKIIISNGKEIKEA